MIYQLKTVNSCNHMIDMPPCHSHSPPTNIPVSTSNCHRKHNFGIFRICRPDHRSSNVPTRQPVYKQTPSRAGQYHSLVLSTWIHPAQLVCHHYIAVHLDVVAPLTRHGSHSNQGRHCPVSVTRRPMST